MQAKAKICELETLWMGLQGADEPMLAVTFVVAGVARGIFGEAWMRDSGVGRLLLACNVIVGGWMWYSTAASHSSLGTSLQIWRDAALLLYASLHSSGRSVVSFPYSCAHQ